MPTRQYDEIIIKAAEKFRLDANLIRAIIETESSGNTNAVRFEPSWHLYNNPSDWAHKLNIFVEEEEKNQATSWGLMQVMGAVARDLGFAADIPSLLHPDIGIFYGCKKLRQLYDRYGDESDVIAGYNAGTPRKLYGMYTNERYVDRVSFFLRDLRKV